MIIDCLSDLHGSYPKLEGGDLLILAGDYTATGKMNQWCDFFGWLKKQEYRKKILIAGNHDNLFESGWPKSKEEAEELKEVQEFPGVDQEDFEYLCDSGTEFEGFKIWGSPWTPRFLLWYFMKERGEDIKQKWDLIPEDTDILITHGPPNGIRDKVKDKWAKHIRGAGCEELRIAIDRIKPMIHIFGHVHEEYGIEKIGPTLFMNAAHMNEHYEPVNQPIRIVL